MDLEDLSSSSLHDLSQFTTSNLKFIPALEVIYSCSHICRHTELGTHFRSRLMRSPASPYIAVGCTGLQMSLWLLWFIAARVIQDNTSRFGVLLCHLHLKSLISIGYLGKLKV